MALISTHKPWLFIFGLLGNISSFVVFLDQIPTFHRIWKKKSTEGFHSLPHLIGLLSAMFGIYYTLLKADAFYLIGFNAFGCVVETIYIALYITYAPRKDRISTLILLLLLNFVGFCTILLLSHFLTEGSTRVGVLGWICMVFSLIVFVAPLSMMRLVILTKSVKYMTFKSLLLLTISAVMWLFHSIFLKDLYVMVPNILGLICGLLQMVLYAVYRNNGDKNIENKEQKENDHQNFDQTGNIMEVFDWNPKIVSEV